MRLSSKRVLMVCIVMNLVLLFPRSAHAVEVDFSDPTLESLVRDALDIWSGPITDTDMLGLTTLNAPGVGIEDLHGLEYATNLQGLMLSMNNISDVTPIAGLTNLRALLLDFNQIEVLNFGNCDFSSLLIFNLEYNPAFDVRLNNAVLDSASFRVLMGVDGSPFAGIASSPVETLDMSGIDFASIPYLYSMYPMDNLQRLSLAGATNIEETELCYLIDELDSLNWLDVTGLWEELGAPTQGFLSAWGDSVGHVLITGGTGGGEVVFADDHLEFAVRDFLFIPEPEPIMITDMETITSFIAPGMGIADLDGLQYATNMEYLELQANQIVALDPLVDLVNLRSLYLNENQINNITPLSGLVNLTTLNLSDNQIADIAPLSSLTNLGDLNLSFNQIVNIAPISFLTNLTKLDLNNNDIVDISSISNLTKLTTLYLSHNEITDISSVSYLSNLSSLGLYDNNVVDISPVFGLSKLNYLDLRSNNVTDILPVENLTELSYLYLSNNQITDITPISGLNDLLYLLLSGNQITDISPIAGLTRMDYLDLSNNQITDVSAVSHLIKLRTLYLRDNQISTLDLSDSCYVSLELFSLRGNPVHEVLLVNATLDQDVFDVLMNGGGTSSYYIGIAELDGVLSLDMSGVDFSQISDLSEMYAMDDLEMLLLVDAANLDGSEVVALTNELASLHWLDVTGLWDGFDTTSQDSLLAWDAIEGNTLVTAVPEPTTLCMLLALVGCLTMLRKKRK